MWGRVKSAVTWIYGGILSIGLLIFYAVLALVGLIMLNCTRDNMRDAAMVILDVTAVAFLVYLLLKS